MLFIPGNWSIWRSCPQHVSSLTCVEEWLPLPPVLQVDENIEGGEEGKGKAGGDEDEGDAPEVLVDRHPAALLAATTEESPQAASEKRPGQPTSETVSMPWVHLGEMLTGGQKRF